MFCGGGLGAIIPLSRQMHLEPISGKYLLAIHIYALLIVAFINFFDKYFWKVYTHYTYICFDDQNIFLLLYIDFFDKYYGKIYTRYTYICFDNQNIFLLLFYINFALL